MIEIVTRPAPGITATMLGMVHDENDPIDFLMARNVTTVDHTYQTSEGYTKTVDYSGWHTTYDHWNTSRFNYPDNPFWGSVWVTNTRSKDDVPHIYMAIPHIAFAADRAPQQSVREACGETLAYLRLFTKDIVEHGYRIRTKDSQGVPYEPGFTGDPEKDGEAGDLASFTKWEELIPGAECNAMRATALIATGTGDGLDCGTAEWNTYEGLATATHYYNHAIVRFFHLAHIANALIARDDKAARTSLEGMAKRIEDYQDTPDEDLPCSRSEWEKDLALLALRNAAFGLPLTSREARLIVDKWSTGVDEFKDWENWNLWRDGLADGEYPYRPGHTRDDEHWTRIEDMALILEYCWSPLKNPAGVRFVDCEIVADPSRWDGAYLSSLN